MKKEILICVFIILTITISDVLLQRYTNITMNSLNGKLYELKVEIKNDGMFDKSKMEQIKDLWDNNFKMYTCYLEHDELEKINTQLIIIQAGLEVEDKEFVYEEIDKAIYIIDHIESKQMLKLDNIF